MKSVFTATKLTIIIVIILGASLFSVNFLICPININNEKDEEAIEGTKLEDQKTSYSPISINILKGDDDRSIIEGIKSFSGQLNKEIKINQYESLELCDNGEILIIFAHGTEEGIFLGGEFIKWQDLASILSQTNAETIYLATCYGAKVNKFLKGTDKRIIGWDRAIDAYMIGFLIAYMVNVKYLYFNEAFENFNCFRDRVSLLIHNPEEFTPLYWDKIEASWPVALYFLLLDPNELALLDIGIFIYEEILDYLDIPDEALIYLDLVKWIFEESVKMSINEYARNGLIGGAVMITIICWPAPLYGIWIQPLGPNGEFLTPLPFGFPIVGIELGVGPSIAAYLYLENNIHDWTYHTIPFNVAIFWDLFVAPFIIPGILGSFSFKIQNIKPSIFPFHFYIRDLNSDYYTIQSVILGQDEIATITVWIQLPDNYPPQLLSTYIDVYVAGYLIKSIPIILFVVDSDIPGLELQDEIIYDNEPFEYIVDIPIIVLTSRVAAYLYRKDGNTLSLIAFSANPVLIIRKIGFLSYVFDFSWVQFLCSDYTFTIVIEVTDLLGIPRSKSATIYYLDDDKDPPNILIDPEVQTITDAQETIFFEVDVTDPSGISSIVVKYDGEEIGTTSGLYSITSDRELGLYIIEVEATDNDIDRGICDRASTSALGAITITDDDTSPPEIGISYIGTETDGDPGNWIVEIEDPESDIADISVYIDGSFAGDHVGAYPVPSSLGKHTIEVNATNADLDRGSIDQEDNSKTDEVDIIDDDTTPPDIPILLIEDNFLTLNISFIATDDGTGDDQGIGEIYIYVDEELVHSYKPLPTETFFEFIISNNWIMEMGTHHVRVEIIDADNDRPIDALPFSADGVFEVSFEEMTHFVCWEIDSLIEKIQESQDESWRKPAKNSKNTIENKLNEVKLLISDKFLNDAYDKLLFDIKPKLTGLKTDENGQPWGKGIFKNPWVIDEILKEEFEGDCDELLTHIAILLECS